MKYEDFRDTKWLSLSKQCHYKTQVAYSRSTHLIDITLILWCLHLSFLCSSSYFSHLLPHYVTERQLPKLLEPVFVPVPQRDNLAYTFSYPTWKSLLSRDISVAAANVDSCYSLTPVTLDYLRNKNELVAALTSLILSKQTEGMDIREDHYPVSTPLPEKSHQDFFKADEKTYRYMFFTHSIQVSKVKFI